MRCSLWLALAVCSLPLQARADRVHLVGGAVIEGDATRVGEKVLLEVQSGQLTLPVASVVRIEESETDVERVQKRLDKLRPDDVNGLLALASFCRDHDMRGRERELLQKVIAVAPDHPEARARLGYVKGAEGHWLTRDEQRRAQGLVLYAGSWLTPAQRLELEQREAEARLAKIARDKAELELEIQKLALAQKRLEAEHAARPRQEPNPEDLWRMFPPVYVGPVVSPGGGCIGGTCMPSGWNGPEPFPIPGVRDPRDMTFSIPGAKDPRSYY